MRYFISSLALVATLIVQGCLPTSPTRFSGTEGAAQKRDNRGDGNSDIARNQGKGDDGTKGDTSTTPSTPPHVLMISPNQKTLLTGQSESFTAYWDSILPANIVSDTVTWSLSNNSVATLSATTGSTISLLGNSAVTQVTLLATSGTASASAVIQINASAPTITSIAINPVTKNIPAGLTDFYTAVATYTDASTRDVTSEVTWSVNDAAYATSLGNGSFKGLLSTAGRAAGSSLEVTAKLNSNPAITATAALVVSAAKLVSLRVDPTFLNIEQGLTSQIQAYATFTNGQEILVTTNPNSSWTSSDQTRAPVNNTMSKGLVSGLTPGQAIVNISFNDQGIVRIATTQVIVGPRVPRSLVVTLYNMINSNSMYVTTTAQASATLVYGDGTGTDVTEVATWWTDDATKLNVSNDTGSKGKLTGLNISAVAVRASYSSLTDAKVVNVIQVIIDQCRIDPDQQQIRVNDQLQMRHYVKLRHLTNEIDGTSNSTWAAGSPQVAVMNSNSTLGLARGISPGNSAITAVYTLFTGATCTSSTNLFVNNYVTALRIDYVNPSDGNVYIGDNVSLKAVQVYATGSEVDVTSSTAFSFTPSYLQALNPNGTFRATSFGPGRDNATVNVTGSKDGMSATKAVIVVKRLTSLSLQIAQGSALFKVGETIGLRSLANYNNGDAINVTQQSTWTRDNQRLNDQGGDPRVFKAKFHGWSWIKAEFGGFSAVQSVTIQTRLENFCSVSAGETGAPRVVTFKLENGLPQIASFYAYPSNTRNGVRSVLGNFNDSNDLQVASASGSGQQTTVNFRTVTGTQAPWGFPDLQPFSHADGASIAACDLDGNGKSSLLVGSLSGRSHVKVYKYGAQGMYEAFGFYAFDGLPDDRGVIVGCTRMNDGKYAILASRLPGQTPGVRIFDTTSFPPAAGSYIDNPFGGNFTGGTLLGSGDFDRDGYDDWILSAAQNGSPRVVIRKGFGYQEIKSFYPYIPEQYSTQDFSFGVHAVSGLFDLTTDVPPVMVTVAGMGGSTHVKVLNNILSTPGLVTEREVFADQGFRGGGYISCVQHQRP